MVIYFAGSTRDLVEDIEAYRKILDTVRKLGNTIANDWVETAWLRQNKSNGLPKYDWDLVREAESGILSSEVVIVEASGASAFGVGYEVAIAIHHQKPVLLLVKKDAASMSYATGLKSDFITYKKYTLSNVEKTVEDFIRENTVRTKDMRFNFVVDRRAYNHLRLKSFKTGKTKAEILRDLLLDDMSKH